MTMDLKAEIAALEAETFEIAPLASVEQELARACMICCSSTSYPSSPNVRIRPADPDE